MPQTETPARKTMRRWFELKLGERAAMLLHQAKQRQLLNRLAMKTQDGTLGQQDPHVDRALGSEEMGVHIGDIYHAPPVSPTASQQPAMPWWIKAGIAAALLASGGTLGVGVASYLAGSGADTDTQYELRLGGESETP